MRLLACCETLAPIRLALALGGCSLGGMLGGGGKPPPTLLTLTPEARPGQHRLARGNAGQAVTIATPVVPKRIADGPRSGAVGPTDVAICANLQWVDTPDRLFQDLLEETCGARPTASCSIPSSRRSIPGWSSRAAAALRL
jgi:cholesterol transport system auxiliary component